jgi:hypothetical protein
MAAVAVAVAVAARACVRASISMFAEFGCVSMMLRVWARLLDGQQGEELNVRSLAADRK